MSEKTSSSGMQRRDFLKFGAAATAAASPLGCALASGTSSAKGGKRPNIVYVFSDEHRWQSMPFTEGPQMITPNMERLAAEGTSLNNCCSTSPICVPYRAMFITGQWPHQSGYVSNHWYGDGKSIGINSPTIAHAFRQGGYKTGYVGKWHLMNETCKNAGFEYFKHWLYGDEHWDTQVRDIPSGEDFHSVKGYNAIGMTDQAIEFMDDASQGEQPFFLVLSLNPPHWRWDDAPEEYMKLYPDEKMTFRPNVEEKYKEGKERFYFQNYQAHITGVDVQLGRIMDYLKEKGLEEDTILIYTSDHGSSFGSNGVSSKANPFDEAIRIPFIARWPGHIPAGKTIDHNVGTMDMFPTLCGLAGITATAECGGENFSPVLQGMPGPDPETQYLCVNSFPRNYLRNVVRGEHTTYFCPFRGVRSKQYSYVVNADGEWFLYDNENDPYQM
jgi:arylsulfatase A-like enzyme